MKKIVNLLMVTIVLFLVSCEKYPDGGLVKKGDERIEGTWKLTSYLRNGTNETSLIAITGYTETYAAGGIFSRSYTEPSQGTVSEEGEWGIASDNLTLTFMGISSISNFSDANSTLSYSSVTIQKLDKSELWFEFENGGDVHEFRLTKQ